MGVYTEGREILKDIVKLANGINDMDLKNKIFELQSKFYELNDENRDLRLENEQLKNNEIIDYELERYGNFLKRKNDKEDNYYCMFCWDNESKLLRTYKDHLMGDIIVYRCVNCNQSSSDYGQVKNIF